MPLLPAYIIEDLKQWKKRRYSELLIEFPLENEPEPEESSDDHPPRGIAIIDFNI